MGHLSAMALKEIESNEKLKYVEEWGLAHGGSNYYDRIPCRQITERISMTTRMRIAYRICGVTYYPAVPPFCANGQSLLLRDQRKAVAFNRPPTKGLRSETRVTDRLHTSRLVSITATSKVASTPRQVSDISIGCYGSGSALLGQISVIESMIVPGTLIAKVVVHAGDFIWPRVQADIVAKLER